MPFSSLLYLLTSVLIDYVLRYRTLFVYVQCGCFLSKGAIVISGQPLVKNKNKAAANGEDRRRPALSRRSRGC